MESNDIGFRHVSYQWNKETAADMEGDEIALLLYRSNLLGADLRLTNYGGGNTSCKITETDPLSGQPAEVMYVKGSGGNLGSLRRNGLSSLYLQRMEDLRSVYKGIETEDSMVALFDRCLFEPGAAAPSIDTPLHAFLPFRHIDHLHPDAAIAIAAAADGRKINEELFAGAIGWVDWQRPGFDLGLKLRACLEENPGIRGIMLGGHGLFTWGDTSHDCYVNTLEVIEKYAAYLEEHYGKNKAIFGGQKIASVDSALRKQIAAKVAPVLRGLCSTERNMIGHFTDDPAVMEFISSHDVARLAAMGTSCPDHFLRTKIAPLLLPLAVDEDLTDPAAVREKLSSGFETYRQRYRHYYEQHRHPDSPPMRDTNPVIILYPGIGMFAYAKDKQTARIAAEFYTNAINVMKGAEAVSSYVSLPLQEAFNIEYWLLEEAKLKRLPAPRPLTGRVALVTGSGGGIGKAIAEKFAEEGACVILTDINAERLAEAAEEFGEKFGHDSFVTSLMNVTNKESTENCLIAAVVAFGGVDIIANNAGLSISKPIAKTTIEDWDTLQDILVKGQFLVTQASVDIMRRQSMGGDIVNIVSKNAVVSGPDNVGYSTAKAAQLHMTRLLAAELGGERIRVNAVNPDAVIAGSNIWANGWAAGRAQAYGIKEEQLPEFYARRTLLKTPILPTDIANAVFAFIGGLLNKSTGNVLNVDGGVPAAFLR